MTFTNDLWHSAVPEAGDAVMGREGKIKAALFIVLTLALCLQAKGATVPVIDCRGSKAMAINAPGGVAKPGWAPGSFDDFTVQLLVTEKGEWDVRSGTKDLNSSLRDRKCQVGQLPSKSIDLVIFGLCPSSVETFFFLDREGKSLLFATSINSDPTYAGTFEYESECTRVSK